MNILVIPDSHASPQSPNTRFEALGNLLVERRPDVIVNIGDMADMSTLSSYDKGLKQAWNKTYKADCESVRNAQEKLFKPLHKYNNTMGKKKKAGYHPRTIHTLGNHCAGRYESHLQKNPEFEGHIDISDLKYGNYWDEIVPYLQPIIVSNIAFSHFFYVKSSKYPISSCRIALKAFHSPMVWGHSHSFDFALDFGIDGRKISAVNVGCYLEPDSKVRGDTFSYVGKGSLRWWNGVVMLNDVNEYGEFDLETISTDRIYREYL